MHVYCSTAKYRVRNGPYLVSYLQGDNVLFNVAFSGHIKKVYVFYAAVMMNRN